ncbi:hypothetical protein KP509_11G080500 [Ceratopteris richardii]|uniref:RRM domain-containing protein n=1 Tax=Ceratopteris richardii TaxID=49495 RepID=A0A8T2TR24_CERRI|nr:hypothetical protein KP509_11G080500 [Ceratopteris richardii]
MILCFVHVNVIAVLAKAAVEGEAAQIIIMSRNPSCTIYVGNLPGDVREDEIEDLFYKYGRIVDIELKLPPRPPGFCFVEFEDARDAEDAIEGRNGYKYAGNYLRVELAHGGRGPPSSGRNSHSSGRGAPIPRRAEFRVYVSKLPQTASWQDLKDHMRKAGDVSFAQVFREGGGTVGIVDYTNYEDMKYAIRKLDDSEFRNRYSRAFIRVGFQLIALPRNVPMIVAFGKGSFSLEALSKIKHWMMEVTHLKHVLALLGS